MFLKQASGTLRGEVVFVIFQWVGRVFVHICHLETHTVQEASGWPALRGVVAGRQWPESRACGDSAIGWCLLPSHIDKSRNLSPCLKLVAAGWPVFGSGKA